LGVADTIRMRFGNVSSIKSLAITANGSYAASASSDGTLRTWELAGTEVLSFTADSPLCSCGVSPDGLTLVAGDQAGTVHLLRVERGQGRSASMSRPHPPL
jgi:WD40 repeat protein